MANLTQYALELTQHALAALDTTGGPAANALAIYLPPIQQRAIEVTQHVTSGVLSHLGQLAQTYSTPIGSLAMQAAPYVAAGAAVIAIGGVASVKVWNMIRMQNPSRMTQDELSSAFVKALSQANWTEMERLDQFIQDPALLCAAYLEAAKAGNSTYMQRIDARVTLEARQSAYSVAVSYNSRNVIMSFLRKAILTNDEEFTALYSTEAAAALPKNDREALLTLVASKNFPKSVSQMLNQEEQFEKTDRIDAVAKKRAIESTSSQMIRTRIMTNDTCSVM